MTIESTLSAVAAPEPLQAFHERGVLSVADVHVARCLVALDDGDGVAPDDGDGDGAVLLAAALAVRAPRLGHVCVDLAGARDALPAGAEEAVDWDGLPWPALEPWVERLEASRLVGSGEEGPDDRPLRLVGTRVYLDRYWRHEREVAADLHRRAGGVVPGVDAGRLAEGLERLFGPANPDGPDLQRLAAATAVLRHLTVVAGGPGTGKTTTVARILALLDDQAAAAGVAPPRVALAAPTGKAAARLEEAVRGEAARLALGPDVRTRLGGLPASTLHRLLGWRPGTRSRFRHDGRNHLPHSVVVVDEASMVSLSLMAKLVDAVRPEARLILVGDPGQLASVEAGAVLSDIVGPAATALRIRAPFRAQLAKVTGQDVPAREWAPGAVLGDGIVLLRRVHRYGAGIAALADAVRVGDVRGALGVLDSPAEGLAWVPTDAVAALSAPGGLRTQVASAGRQVLESARAGDGAGALEHLGAFRLLCAHRRGPAGVATWTGRIESWLAGMIPGYGSEGEWYVGRPLLVTENDYELRLYNGDTGVVVTAGDGRVTAAFERGGDVVQVSPARLAAVETVHAMTVHKSQGSQFDTVVVVLPDPASPLLTRELLYTAITRARRLLTVVGEAGSIEAAVARPVARASGLEARLWGG